MERKITNDNAVENGENAANMGSEALPAPVSAEPDATAPRVPVGVSNYMRTIGRAGGKIGGKKRWRNYSPEQLSEAMRALVAKREADRERKRLSQPK